eukprot:353435-Chlamydomonas_euryale.AAC.4
MPTHTASPGWLRRRARRSVASLRLRVQVSSLHAWSIPHSIPNLVGRGAADGTNAAMLPSALTSP